nr:tRNA pseudouridine(55) synthase TruB [Bifidobacterium santillanense]
MLIVDKPRGVTSFDAVAAVRGALRTKKVGHAGTLDPMATGMLVIGFGRATRLLQYIVEHDKTYEATIRLGAGTTTDDAEGEMLVDPVAADRLRAADADSWHAAIASTIAERFLGDIEQVPNAFSAIKIDGRRAYDLAREGRDVDLKARPVHVAEFAVLDVRPGRTDAGTAGSPLIASPARGGETEATIPVIDVDVRVTCSSGTYIRALARDLGAALGVGGHLTRLRRTRVGRFALSDDASGLAATVALPTDRGAADAEAPDATIRAVTAHTESKTFINREGETVTRGKCVLDTPEGLSGEERAAWLVARSVPMGEAARGAMPAIDIDADEARELRFGRRIERALDKGVQTAAIVPAHADGFPDDVVAIVERANAHQAKPVVVFPKD